MKSDVSDYRIKLNGQIFFVKERECINRACLQLGMYQTISPVAENGKVATTSVKWCCITREKVGCPGDNNGEAGNNNKGCP